MGISSNTCYATEERRSTIWMGISSNNIIIIIGNLWRPISREPRALTKRMSIHVNLPEGVCQQTNHTKTTSAGVSSSSFHPSIRTSDTSLSNGVKKTMLSLTELGDEKTHAVINRARGEETHAVVNRTRG